MGGISAVTVQPFKSASCSPAKHGLLRNSASAPRSLGLSLHLCSKGLLHRVSPRYLLANRVLLPWGVTPLGTRANLFAD